MTTKRGILIVVWVAAIALAMSCDRAVAVWVRDHGVDEWLRSHDVVADILKSPGTYYFTVPVAIAVGFAHSLRWRAGGFMLLATVVSGMNGLIKWMVGRTRPFKLFTFDAMDVAGRPQALPFTVSPFRGGLAGLLHSTNLCFPSGHAALAFATAAALAMLWPRAWWRWAAYGVAVVVACERVGENAHWLSDTVAAAALGVGGVQLIHWVVTKVITTDARPVGSRLLSQGSSETSSETSS